MLNTARLSETWIWKVCITNLILIIILNVMLVKKREKPLKDHPKIAMKEIWYTYSNISEIQSMITTRLRFIKVASSQCTKLP